MVTLGLICIFLSFILVIMGLLAWGSMQPKEPEQPQAELPVEATPPPTNTGEQA